VRLSLYVDDAETAADLMVKYRDNLRPAGKKPGTYGEGGWTDSFRRLVANDDGHFAIGKENPAAKEAVTSSPPPPPPAGALGKASPRAPPADLTMSEGLGFIGGRPLQADEVKISPSRPRSPPSGEATSAVVPARALAHKPSWLSDRTIAPTPGKTTTLIGNYKGDMQHVLGELKYPKTTDFGPKEGSFNLLNVPDNVTIGVDFWKQFNEPWLRQATNRGDVVVLMSNPADPALLSRGGRSTGFGREVEFMDRLVAEGKYVFVEQEGRYVPRR
jgi:hypothetical protein